MTGLGTGKGGTAEAGCVCVCARMLETPCSFPADPKADDFSVCSLCAVSVQAERRHQLVDCDRALNSSSDLLVAGVQWDQRELSVTTGNALSYTCYCSHSHT